jgi:hypothetical protein
VDGRRGYTDDAGSQWYPEQPEYPDREWDRRDEDWTRRGDGGWRDDDLPAVDRPHGARAEQASGSPRHASVDWSGQSQDERTRPLQSPTNPLAAVSAAPMSASPAVSASPMSPGPMSASPMSPGPMSHGVAAPGQAGMAGPAGPAAVSGPPGVGQPPMSGGPAMPGAGAAPGVAPAASAPREGVYRSGRPALAMLYLVGVVLFEWPAIRLFTDGAFGDDLSASAAISGIFLMIGLPLFGRGLFALQAGAGRVLDQRTGHGWLHPPVAYLIVGLALFLAAGLAAS